ncbi:class A beta-lactamase [Pseudomonas sp. M47T1]|uniref:class A beta-lactamase n=1 Tax=Pseudomonas sp. M47T1 TaxID=1179778 RepID=UPI0009DA4111
MHAYPSPPVAGRRPGLLGAGAAGLGEGPRPGFQALESNLGGRLGVWALDTATGATLGYREEERFAFCSTFKVMLAGAILHRNEQQPGLLQQRIAYRQGQLVSYSPVTERHVATGMTVAQLCAAGLQYSDNTAANLLLGVVGGTAVLTAFARSLNDPAFRLDRYETALNSALPGDVRDTTTPRAMASSLQHLALGDGLAAPSRAQLQQWLRGNTTGEARIRAGVPSGWAVGDKTGSGDYGVANDVAVIWPAARAPWVLAVYTRATARNAQPRSEVIAEATRLVVKAWS